MKKTKKLICLEGSPNTGKSATINKLWEDILVKYKNGSDNDYVHLFVDTGNYDFVGVITSVAGHKIGINSRGDDSGWIERWNRKLAENKCDIIFCACRKNEKCENAVKMFNQKGYKVTFITKEKAESKKAQKEINEKQADELLQYCDS